MKVYLVETCIYRRTVKIFYLREEAENFVDNLNKFIYVGSKCSSQSVLYELMQQGDPDPWYVYNVGSRMFERYGIKEMEII